MKIQPRRLGFIVLAVVAILTFLNCSQRGWFGKGKDAFVLNIGNKGFLGIGDEYVPVDQGNLDKALNALSGTQAVYDIYFLDHDGGTVIPHYTPRPHTSLKTNRVIKSDVAEQMLAEASSANDPNAMHKVQSPDPGDIKTVLDAFTSTPTPTP
jgi:hypothetical protein